MRPAEIAKLFSEYLEAGTTPKGTKVKSFFGNLPAAQKRLVAKNVAKAYEDHLQAEKEKVEARKKRRKEISELKKKAKELGMVLKEA
jgi:succinylglutamate desuccinylase